MSEARYEEITEALVSLDGEKTVALTRKALEDGIDPAGLIAGALTPAMGVIGAAFERDEVFLPELLVAAEIFKDAIELVKPHLTGTAAAKAKVVMGTVEGDIHDIGKNVVILFLETNGFEVRDIGRDMPAARFAEAALEMGADIVGASAMLTSTEHRLKEVVEAVQDAGSPAAVLVGGAPVSEALAAAYGADGTAKDAAAAVRVAEAVLERRQAGV